MTDLFDEWPGAGTSRPDSETGSQEAVPENPEPARTQAEDGSKPADQIEVSVTRTLTVARKDADATGHEVLIHQVEALGYRVLTRVPKVSSYNKATGKERRGVIIDTETTGLDPETCHIIELSMIPFTYDSVTGKVCNVEEAFSWLEDPGYPLPEEITRITGLTDSDLKGKKIDTAKASEILASSDLVIAHNAEFDRPFVDQRIPVSQEKPWACSMADVPWKSEHGMGNKSLEYLLFMGLQAFYDAHRAEDDCRATLHLLACDWQGTNVAPFQELLANARRREVMVWAFDSPFSSKQDLKSREYKWFEGDSKIPKCWRKVIAEEEAEAEIAWLTANVYHGGKKARSIRVSENSRKVAFSSRLGPVVSMSEDNEPHVMPEEKTGGRKRG